MVQLSWLIPFTIIPDSFFFSLDLDNFPTSSSNYYISLNYFSCDPRLVFDDVRGSPRVSKGYMACDECPFCRRRIIAEQSDNCFVRYAAACIVCCFILLSYEVIDFNLTKLAAYQQPSPFVPLFFSLLFSF